MPLSEASITFKSISQSLGGERDIPGKLLDSLENFDKTHIWKNQEGK